MATTLKATLLFAAIGLSVVSPAKGTPDDTAGIRRYCAQIDSYLKKHAGEFVDVQRDRGPRNDGNGAWKVTPKAELDEPLDSNAGARVWRRNGHVVFVLLTIQSDSRDWALFVSNYYRPDGSLAKLESTLNTFIGDVSVDRDWYYASDGTLVDFSARYYKLATRHRTKLDDYFEDQTVPLYRTVAQLPFQKLLRRNAAPN